MATVGADKEIIVRNIANRAHPKIDSMFATSGFVKAMAFCPWCPSLLAIGEFSNENYIR